MSWPISSDVLVVTLVVAAGAAATVVDLGTRRVPNTLTGGVALAGLLLAAAGAGRAGLAAAALGALVGLLVMLPGHLLGATGGGDVKLLAALGTLLGPERTLTAFVLTALAGGVIALAVALRRRRLVAALGATARAATGRPAVPDPGADHTFAYAPAIAIGAALAVIGA